MAQNIFLRIVKTWSLKELPEYRGFRCANCQKYMRRAWYHWLDAGGYKTPVHFCNVCEKDFRLSRIKVFNPQVKFDRRNFGLDFPQKIKARIMKISNDWKTGGAPIYKMFTCDECGKDMFKAWHVWANLRGLLVETHFCKNCGERLGFLKIIRGVIYDLDGTLISTLQLHRAGWLAAGKKFNARITEKMLLDQNGMADETAALMMLPKEKSQVLQQFVKVKQNYIRKNARKISLFPQTVETINRLTQKGYRIWICTSAYKFFAKKALSLSPALQAAIKDNVVWREMYKRAKPSADSLSLTIKKMGLKRSQVCYVGDALKDYGTSLNARIKFIYFCPDAKRRDKRIPGSVFAIQRHGEILEKGIIS